MSLFVCFNYRKSFPSLISFFFFLSSLWQEHYVERLLKKRHNVLALLAGSWTSEGYRQYQVSREVCEQGQELVCIWIFKTNLHEWRGVSVIWQVYSYQFPKPFNNNINRYLIKTHFPDTILTPFYVTRDLLCYNEYFDFDLIRIKNFSSSSFIPRIS